MIRRLSDRFWNYLTDRIEARMHLRPSKDNAFDLGSSDYAWRRAYVGPGSASAPSISPAGDPDTGIYQSAADNLDFATGGSNRLNISSAGLQYVNDLKPYRNSTAYTAYAFVPLTTALTSTSFDADAFSDTAKTKIDLSAVFGAPAGIKAVAVEVIARDSGSASGTAVVTLGSNDTAYEGPTLNLSGLPNDVFRYDHMIVPCDANGDIYYEIQATGAGTLDLILRIWGYWL